MILSSLDVQAPEPRLLTIVKPKYHVLSWFIKWASAQENMSSGFPTKSDLKQPAQLQGLARIVKFDFLQI